MCVFLSALPPEADAELHLPELTAEMPHGVLSRKCELSNATASSMQHAFLLQPVLDDWNLQKYTETGNGG